MAFKEFSCGFAIYHVDSDDETNDGFSVNYPTVTYEREESGEREETGERGEGGEAGWEHGGGEGDGQAGEVGGCQGMDLEESRGWVEEQVYKQ